MIHVVSLSGGRSSGHLVWLMEQKRIHEGWDVRYVFMDTGIEHPLTLRFVREIVKFWDIPLVCLQAEINPVLGEGNSYTVWEAKDIQTRMPALKPFVDMIAKYGTPYIGGAFCTDRLKLQPFKKYCNDHFGKGGYISWIGIRADEHSRLTPKLGVRYLAELSDFDKQDILDWWAVQPFNLLIPEHLGNCVFCIKKSIKKLGLATMEEVGLVKMMGFYIASDAVRDGHRKTAKEIMYRGHHSLASIAALYQEQDYFDVYTAMVKSKHFNVGSCSESCEVFS